MVKICAYFYRNHLYAHMLACSLKNNQVLVHEQTHCQSVHIILIRFMLCGRLNHSSYAPHRQAVFRAGRPGARGKCASFPSLLPEQPCLVSCGEGRRRWSKEKPSLRRRREEHRGTVASRTRSLRSSGCLKVARQGSPSRGETGFPLRVHLLRERPVPNSVPAVSPSVSSSPFVGKRLSGRRVCPESGDT